MLKQSATGLNPAQALSPPALATLFCWFFSLNEIDVIQALLAFLLLLIPWSSYLGWRSGKRRDFPLFTMIAFMHWIYFAQPLFWGSHNVPGLGSEAPRELITLTLAMAVLGVGCLWIGMRTPIEIWDPGSYPISPTPR